jgi:ribosomal protein S18 acetylase RimI-like enzyme
MPEIRPATEGDFVDIWRIFRLVIEPGDTYTFGPETTREQARDFWMASGSNAFVGIVEGTIRGAYLVRPNQPGLGSHIANAAFIVDPVARGLGLGESMGWHALAEAKARGFRAMQFNIVVSTNEPAVRLWTKLGFTVVGTLPGAFRHAQLGFVDAYVMFRTLD